MSSSVIQFKTDKYAKILASRICEAMGMDLATYLRMCIVKLNQEGRIPFDTALNAETASAIKVSVAMEKAAAIKEAAAGEDKDSEQHV